MSRRRAPRVEYYFDPGSKNWGFTVDDPSIIGGGDATREEAERHAAKVIAQSLTWEQEEAGEAATAKTGFTRT